MTDLMNILEKVALGELAMTPEQFGNATIAEIEALAEGFERRREILEDLFIINCALPMYRAWYGKKAPTYKDLTAYRRNRTGPLPAIDPNLIRKWKPIL